MKRDDHAGSGPALEHLAGVGADQLKIFEPLQLHFRRQDLDYRPGKVFFDFDGAFGTPASSFAGACASMCTDEEPTPATGSSKTAWCNAARASCCIRQAGR